jgi:hypothetical protein
MKKRKIFLLVILGIIALIVIFFIIASLTSSVKVSEIYKEYQGTYSGNDDYENQIINVTKDSVNGALVMERLFIMSTNDYVIEDGSEKLTWAYVHRYIKGTQEKVIGLVLSVDTLSENDNIRIIAFGKDASILAKTLQEAIKSKEDTIGSYKVSYLSALILTKYDETYNWVGEKNN